MRTATNRLLERVCILFLVMPFIVSGVSKLLNFAGAIDEVTVLSGLSPGWLFAALVIATQLGGSALLLVGGKRFGWIGAAALAGFTIVATLLAHAWWRKEALEAVRDFNIFWEHLGLVGGLLLAGLITRRAPPSS